MPVTTRKRSAPAAKPQPSDEDLFNCNPNAALQGAITYRDDDPFERAFDNPIESIEASDSELDVSDFADKCKKRKGAGRYAAKKERKRQRKMQKKRAMSREPDLPDLSDDLASSEDEEGDIFNSGEKILVKPRIGVSSLSSTQKQGLLGLIVSGMPDTLRVADLVQLIAANATNDTLVDSEEGTLMSTTDSKKRQKTGFMTFPFEVRVRIYRMCLKDDKPIKFTTRENFSRQAQLLRVCKQVADEGTTILYGANSFHFERCTVVRGKFWETNWSQIGFKDIRRFLETIGSTNISKLKHLTFVLADGSPYGAGCISASRRFVHDPVLFRVFNIIGSHACLEKLGIIFNGGSDVDLHDYYFLKALTAMKCYELHMPMSAMGIISRIDVSIWDKVKQLIEVEQAANIDKTKKKVKVNMFFEKSRAGSYSAVA